MLGLGGRVKEAGLGSAWMLSESGDNSILQHLNNYFWYINNSYLENRRNKAKLKLYLVPKERAGITHISQDWGMFGHFCSLDKFLFLSDYRHDYTVALFLS